MLYNSNLSLMFFLMSCLMFSFFYKHLLLTLISLEFMMINIMLNLYMNLLYLKMNLFLITFFMTISVCESIIGLSLLVFMVRMMGNDYMKMLNLMKW